MNWFEAWRKTYASHEYDTHGFTLDLEEIPPRKILYGMFPVLPEFIAATPKALEQIKPKYHAQVKNAVAYLIQLAALQSELQQRESKYLESLEHGR